MGYPTQHKVCLSLLGTEGVAFFGGHPTGRLLSSGLSHSLIALSSPYKAVEDACLATISQRGPLTPFA